MLKKKIHFLLKKQIHPSPRCPRCAIGCVCLLGLALLSACGKTTSSSSPNTPTAAKPSKPVTSTTAISDSRLDAEISKALNSSLPSSPSISSRESDLTAEAEDILARYPDKNAIELLNVPEVNEKLRNGLKKLGENPALGKQINSTVELAAKLKGLEGAPGSVRLDLDTKNYDKARTARMLETVLSEDPKRIVSFLVEEIGEATPELSLGGVERASNGIAIKEQTPPPAAK